MMSFHDMKKIDSLQVEREGELIEMSKKDRGMDSWMYGGRYEECCCCADLRSCLLSVFSFSREGKPHMTEASSLL